MGWTELEQGDVVALGGDEGQHKKAGGLLVRIELNQGTKKNSAIYSFVQEDGEVVKVWGCATVDNTVNEMHIGKFIGLKFTGMEENRSGTPYKNVKVNIWEGKLDDRLKAWPMAKKFYGEIDDEDNDPDSELPF